MLCVRIWTRRLLVGCVNWGVVERISVGWVICEVLKIDMVEKSDAYLELPQRTTVSPMDIRHRRVQI